ncbi:unnamed protein product [Blepharisma stoltei]|uniref:Tetratricopeptide repeat protein n=1 Tax=Blepharisma stoltei TaxID=1481888 RepID=A0AAU9JNB7_9CILI|nr:unnamed protein product [Blepharisma stoltei]
MMAKKCSLPGCMNEVGCACKCSSPETLLCGEHIGEHANLPNRAHNLESIFMQPCEGTKKAILILLAKENSKYSELRRKIRDSFSNSEKDLGDFTSKLDCYLDEINDSIEKISQSSKLLKSEQDPILGLLSLQPQEAIEKVKLMTIASRNWYNGAKLYYIFNQKLENLNRSFFTEICGAYLEKRGIQITPEMHNKTNKPASIESANVKDSVSLIINENSECLKGPKNENKPIKKPPDNETNLLNFQMSIVSNNINNETDSASDVIGTLRNKTAEIFSRPNNPELEIDFRITCSAIHTNSFDPPLMQAYQDYLNAYQQKTSLYNTTIDKYNKTNLIIYNTETETEEVKIFQTPESLDVGTCITQLPNGKLFCFGNYYRHSGITVLIDVNGGFEVLPSGTPCGYSSCIYFNSSVYCFGGENGIVLNLSSRFDLDQNRWIQLPPMPKADYQCNSIIFNGNILISGYENRNLLLYSIEIDSFSTIPLELARERRKILINAERLYLIECCLGSIYESEVGIYSNWRRIGKSKINCVSSQVYCSYNKGRICISNLERTGKEYYCFNLDQKIMIDVAYYNTHVSLRRAGKKIEAIKWNSQNFKLDPYYLDEWSVKDITLKYLGENLENIECYDEAIKLIPNNIDFYKKKGDAFKVLERYLEAIECYDEAIKLNPNNDYLYIYKGNAFFDLERYLEAIQCYDKAIKLKPKDANFYNSKGNALDKLKKYLEAIECYDKAIKLNPYHADFYNNKGRVFYNLQRYLEAIECYDKAIKCNPYNADIYNNNKGTAFFDLQRYLEAIECFDKSIKLNPNNADFYFKKGCSLNKLGRYPEAVKSYDEAIITSPNNAKYYNIKGYTLYILERCQEAIQCYDEAIKLEPNNPLHFCCRARLFNYLRQEEAALQDFNTAYHLKQVSGVFTWDEWKLSEEDINFINDSLGETVLNYS